MSLPHTGMTDSLHTFVNAHTHSAVAPFKGLTRSRPFEAWFVERAGRMAPAPTPDELAACALVTGLENLASGTTAILDHVNAPQTKEHIYAVARAYEALGIRAWVLVDATDLPRVVYTREAYPNYPKAIPVAELPEGMRPLVAPPRPYREQLRDIRSIIEGWTGDRVQIGLALSSPTWCSDGLLEEGAALARELGVPITVHAEESPVQREVCLAQWGKSGIKRLDQFGVLSPRTIVAHCVQIDDEDVEIIARRGANIAHNPTSNLKLQNGIAPVGKLLAAGVNVCLGTDGVSSGDDQSLFTVMRFVSALAGLNGIRDLGGIIEERVMQMATDHGYRLWFAGDPSGDRTALSIPVGPFAAAWCELSSSIDEVWVDGEPILGKARAVVQQRKAQEVVSALAERAMTPDIIARVEEFAAVTAHFNERNA